MIGKLLLYFGLIKVSRARELSRTLHLHYIQQVAEWAKEDFGRKIPLDLIPMGSLWWDENIKIMISLNTDHVTLTKEEVL